MHTQYLALALLGRAAFLAAAPLKSRAAFEKRDNLATIETALTPVFGALSGVDLATVSLDGTPASANRLMAASQEAQTAVNEATIIIRATGDLTVAKSLKLRKSTDTLAAQTKTTLNDLVSRKPILDQLGASNIALATLEQQEAATMSLSDALTQKIPMIGQSEAASDKSNMEAMFNKAIAVYAVPATPVVPVVPVVPAVPVVPGTPAVPVVPVVPVTPAVPAPAPIIIATKEAKGSAHDVDAPVEN